MRNHLPARSRRAAGFSLVELAVVVLIIGMLASMALNSIARIRREARATRFVNDLRVIRDAFEEYAFEYGYYPPDGSAGIPDEMKSSQFLRAMNGSTPVGGTWDWDFDQFGVVAAVSVLHPDDDTELLRSIDRKLDDGNLETGLFRRRSGGMMYVLQEDE